jgi:thiamine biosynthesis lipoprotein
MRKWLVCLALILLASLQVVLLGVEASAKRQAELVFRCRADCQSGLRLRSGAPRPSTMDDPVARFTFSEAHMGTKFQIVLHAKDEATAQKAAKAAFARAAQLDEIMSDYRPTSELMQLCQQAGKGPKRVSPDLFAVLARSQEISRLSDGAFDVTIGPVVRLWRRSRRTRQLPGPDELAKARALVGYDKMRLTAKDSTVELIIIGMLLDLGGIAKGFAAEAMLAILREYGVTRALVAAGGDIVVGDAPPDAKGWKIGIAPLDNPEAKPSRHVLLTNAAVSTSGDTQQYVEIDGKRFSHIVDPKTGLGLTIRSSVTVIAKDGKTADGLATALSVMGPERGLKLIESIDRAAALFIVATDKVQTTHPSKRFAQYELEKSP